MKLLTKAFLKKDIIDFNKAGLTFRIYIKKNKKGRDEKSKDNKKYIEIIRVIY